MKFADEIAEEQMGVMEETSIVRLRRERDSAKKEVVRLTVMSIRRFSTVVPKRLFTKSKSISVS